MNEIKAIETHYRGYRFRSRLEARWAVVLDGICPIAGLEWEYEPQGYALPSGPYLPDFLLKYPDGGALCYLEIKPASVLGGREVQLAHELSQMVGVSVIVLGGQVPLCGYEAADVMPSLVSGRRNVGSVLRAAAFASANGPIAYDSGLPLYRVPVAYLDAALRAGRSARFEHGEAPR